MRNILLLLMLYTASASAQVEFGGGAMSLPSLGINSPSGDVIHPDDPSRGTFGYINIGDTHGLSISFAVDNDRQFEGHEYKEFGIGVGAFHDIELGDFTVGGFVQVISFHTSEKVEGIKKLNIQPFGGLRVGYKALKVQYAPAGNTLTFGIKL